MQCNAFKLIRIVICINTFMTLFQITRTLVLCLNSLQLQLLTLANLESNVWNSSSYTRCDWFQRYLQGIYDCIFTSDLFLVLLWICSLFGSTHLSGYVADLWLRRSATFVDTSLVVFILRKKISIKNQVWNSIMNDFCINLCKRILL